MGELLERLDIFGLLKWRPARFIIAGGTAAAADLTVLYLLVEFVEMWYLAAATLGFLVGMAVSFLLQKLFTFRHYTREKLGRQASLHIGLQLWNLCFNTALMYVAVSLLGAPYLLAQFFISIGIACYNFFFYRHFVFTEDARALAHWVLPLASCALLAIFATAIPALFVVNVAGGLDAWQGVPPHGTTDSLYYYGRMHEVADGHPFIGNPYVFEHRDALSPAFFLPDWLTALPLVLGVPLIFTIVANIFIWSFAFLVLAYALLRQLSLPRSWALGWSLVAYLASYSFMLRPTIMQVVYPAFLLLLLALAYYLKEPHNRRRAFLLAGVAALTFYLYTFLAYVTLLTLAFVFLYYLVRKRWAEVVALLWCALLSALLLVPFGVYTLLQMQDPNYVATMVRIGLVYTHVPAIEAYYYGRWVVFVIVIFALAAWLTRKQEGGGARPVHVLWVASGLALCTALVLNVFTGVELTLAVHIGRIAIPWQPLALAAALFAWWQVRSAGRRQWLPYAAVTLAVLALSVGTLASVKRGALFTGYEKVPPSTAEVQTYAAPLAWLEKNVPEQSVIWSNNTLAIYLPVMTRHYPLFSHAAALHTISDEELVERYLLAQSLAPALTDEDAKRDFDLYAGAGPHDLQAHALNEGADLCKLISRVASRACPSHTDGVTLKGDAYFNAIVASSTAVRKNRDALLATYHVAYLLIDRQSDKNWLLPTTKPVYDDGRFAIWSVPFGRALQLAVRSATGE